MAIVVALALVAMVGIVGLALDLGKLYVARAELQNAADACALAAVHSLDGATTRQLEIAEAAGLTTGLRHRVQFQTNTVSLHQDASIEFAERVDDPWLYKTSLSAGDPRLLRMRHVRCTIAEAGIETWFIQVLNVLPGVQIGLQQVSASAVASLLNSQTTCAIPVAICADKLPVNGQIGQWIRSGKMNSDKDSTEDFRWANLTADSKTSSNRDIADMLAGSGSCELPVTGTEVGVAGVRQSLSKAWNTRFGIYEGGSYSAEDNRPDLSGYAYTTTTWPANPDGSRSNAFDDFIGKRSSNAPYQGDALTGLDTGSVPGLQATHATHGTLRRVAPAPVVDCNDFDKGDHKAPIQYWACMFMLHPLNRGGGDSSGDGKLPKGEKSAGYIYLEYRGKASDAGSPCVSTGLPGNIFGTGPLVPVLSR